MKKEIIDIKVVKEPPIELNEMGLIMWNKCWQSKPKDLEWNIIDYYNLASYCLNMAIHFKCLHIIDTRGMYYTTEKGYDVQRVEVSVGNTALKNAMALSSKLGVSPLDRMKLNITKENKTKKKADPFAQAK